MGKFKLVDALSQRSREALEEAGRQLREEEKRSKLLRRLAVLDARQGEDLREAVELAGVSMR